MRFFLFLFFILSTINAQNLEHLTYHLTSKEGLPDKEIYKIEEDKSGFVWLATNSGLYRYDGTEFKQYRHPKQKKSSVFGLLFDQQGRIWFNTIDGQYFYVENDKVHFFNEFPEKSREILRNFSVIDSYLFITFYDEILKINIKTKQETSIKNNTNIGAMIASVVKYKNDFFISDYQKMYSLKDVSEGNIKFAMVTNAVHTEINNQLFYVGAFRDKKNGFSFFKNNERIPINSLNAVENVSINNIKNINNDLWIFTSRGTYKYTYENKKMVLKDVFLSEKQTTDAIIDSNQNLWITTLNSGIYIVPNQSFHIVERKKKEEYITDLRVVNDSIITFIEGKKYLNQFNTQSKKLQERTLKSFGQALFYDTLLNKIYVFVRETLYTHDVDKNINSYNNFKVKKPKKIIRLNAKEILFSRYNSLALINSENYKLIKQIRGRCQELAYNKNNNLIYVGFSKGLRAGKSVDQLQTVSNKDKRVYAKLMTVKPNSNSVFVVTHDNTIFQIKNTTVTDSIRLNKPHKISDVASDKDYLWIGTNKGVFRYDYGTKKCTQLKKLFDIQVTKIQLTKNFTWISSDTKIIRIPRNYNENLSKTVKPYVKSVTIDNKLVNHQKVISIANKNQNINVKFMINGFKTLASYKFDYKLPKNDWQTFNGNEITLSSLPYGKQTLEVRASNKDKQHKTEGLKITFNVLRPFYASWWFHALLVLCLLAVIYQLVNLRLRIEDKKKEKELQQLSIKQQLTNLQLENLRSQMNPHFIFNALNSIQEYIYANEKKLASSYLVKFSRLIRIYLDHSRLSEISLKKEIKALELYLDLENNRLNYQLEYSIIVDKTLDVSIISVPSLFIQPYVENAIKHGLLHKKGIKNLRITFKLENEKSILKVEITDNGIGREASNNLNKNRYYKSFATKANLSRVSLMNLERVEKITVDTKDLYNENKQATGTKVCIKIPLKS